MVLLLVFIFSILFAQNQEYQFRFNVKKFRKEWMENKQSLQLKIFDPAGRPLTFNIAESSISEQPIPNINTFKGASIDGSKRISLTLTKKTISGSYSDQGTEVYFNPVKDKKCIYKVYVSTPPTGQEQDFVP